MQCGFLVQRHLFIEVCECAHDFGRLSVPYLIMMSSNNKTVTKKTRSKTELVDTKVFAMMHE